MPLNAYYYLYSTGCKRRLQQTERRYQNTPPAQLFLEAHAHAAEEEDEDEDEDEREE